MSYPRAGYMRVCKTGITIINRDHLGIPLCAKPLASLVFPPVMSPMIMFSDGAAQKWGLERKRKLQRYAGLVAVEPHCGPHRRLASTYAHGIFSA